MALLLKCTCFFREQDDTNGCRTVLGGCVDYPVLCFCYGFAFITTV